MSVTDFLFNGSPPPATTSYGSSTTTLPGWYSDYTQGLISKANAIASTPYQAYSGQRIASFSPDQQASFDATRNLGSQFAQNFNPAIQTMQGMQGPNAQTALGQYGGQAQGLYGQAGNAIADNQLGTGNFQVARNLTNQGAGSAAPGISNYMNPYTSGVVNEIGRLGQENLNNTLSNVGNKFIAGGQFGSSRMGQSLGNATRAGLRDIAGQQANALNTGYGQALGASQNDLQRQLQAGSQLGSLAGSQASSLANIGQSLGTFGQSDLQRQIEAARGQGALAQTQNETNLRNIAAQEAVGAQQQNQNQKNLDLAYQQFVEQRDNPQQMASFMNNIIRGLQIPTAQTSTQTGNTGQSQASPLLQLASTASGLGGLATALGKG